MSDEKNGLHALLSELGACDDARGWAKDYATLGEAWAACERADWMLWLAGKSGMDRKVLVRLACACARTALPFVPEGETRPLRAIETAEAWTRGEASIEEVRAAAASAADAACAAYAAAYSAACAAAYSADAADYACAAYAAAYSAACAAAYSADADDDADAAADAADYADDDANKSMSALIRSIQPTCDWSDTVKEVL